MQPIRFPSKIEELSKTRLGVVVVEEVKVYYAIAGARAGSAGGGGGGSCTGSAGVAFSNVHAYIESCAVCH